MGMGFGWMWIWPALIALAVLAVIFALGAGSRKTHEDTTAEDILKERLARGEIDPEDYRKRLGELRT